MMVEKRVYVCDKCGKEIGEEMPDYHYMDLYRYQLCEDCEMIYKEFSEQYDALWKQLDDLLKKYKFGKYMEGRK